MDRWIVVVGGPEGFSYYGPFENASFADEYAEREHAGEDWWLIKLEKPE
jgi:hypothetical protein